jgi:hypothetical protein
VTARERAVTNRYSWAWISSPMTASNCIDRRFYTRVAGPMDVAQLRPARGAADALSVGEPLARA